MSVDQQPLRISAPSARSIAPLRPLTFAQSANQRLSSSPPSPLNPTFVPQTNEATEPLHNPAWCFKNDIPPCASKHFLTKRTHRAFPPRYFALPHSPITRAIRAPPKRGLNAPE